MRTIQMTLDDNLVAAVDKVVKKLNTTRSSFARKALRDAVKQINISMLEKKHKEGYERNPCGKDDCAVNCDHIQTVSKLKVGSLITTLSSDKLREIRDAIHFALNL